MKTTGPGLLAFLLGLAASASVLADGGKPRAVKVTVLSTMLADLTGIGEWGFAALVEVDGYRLLFDTGHREDTVVRNAEELKVDLSNVTDVILSHNHLDHTGGLLTLSFPARSPGASGRCRRPADPG